MPRVWDLSFLLRWKLKLLSSSCDIVHFHAWLPVFRKYTDSNFTVKLSIYVLCFFQILPMLQQEYESYPLSVVSSGLQLSSDWSHSVFSSLAHLFAEIDKLISRPSFLQILCFWSFSLGFSFRTQQNNVVSRNYLYEYCRMEYEISVECFHSVMV
jgi:hypothetical protein